MSWVYPRILRHYAADPDSPRRPAAGRCPAWQASGVETRTGPLDGVKVIEVASLAPAPFGCMVLAGLGADVLRIDRPDRSGRQQLPPVDPLCRSRRWSMPWRS